MSLEALDGENLINFLLDYAALFKLRLILSIDLRRKSSKTRLGLQQAIYQQIRWAKIGVHCLYNRALALMDHCSNFTSILQLLK